MLAQKGDRLAPAPPSRRAARVGRGGVAAEGEATERQRYRRRGLGGRRPGVRAALYALVVLLGGVAALAGIGLMLQGGNSPLPPSPPAPVPEAAIAPAPPPAPPAEQQAQVPDPTVQALQQQIKEATDTLAGLRQEATQLRQGLNEAMQQRADASHPPPPPSP